MTTPAQIVLTELSGDPTAFPAAGQLGLYAKTSVEGFYIIDSGGTVIGPLGGGLSPSGVTPGSYTSANFTVDVNGIVTAASNGSGGGGTPGGSSGMIQYNNSGSFGGNANFVVGTGIPNGTPFSADSPTGNGAYAWIGNNEFSGTDQDTILVGNTSADYAVFQCEVTAGSSGKAALTLGSIAGNTAAALVYQCSNGLFTINHYSGGLTPAITVDTTLGGLQLNVIGGGLSVAEGSNAKQGVVTLSGGTATVSTTAVTSTSRVFITVQSLGTITVPVPVAVNNISAGTSFDIISADPTDTSVVAYFITEAI